MSFELHASIFGSNMPIDGRLSLVALLLLGLDLLLHLLHA